MKKYFQHQTGAVMFDIKIDGTISDGEEVISLGCEGVSEPSVSFSLKTGALIDSDGIIFGGYSRGTDCSIRGIISDGSCCYYYNDNLVRSFYVAKNQDINYIYATGDYSISYEIKGEKREQKNILYISKSGSMETGILNMLSGMNIHDYDIGIRSEYTSYTGDIPEAIINADEIDLVIFGQYTDGADFTGASGWNNVTVPIISLNTPLMGQTGLMIITGEYIETNGDEMSRAWAGEYPLKEEYASVATRRMESGNENGYLMTNIDDGTYFFYEKFKNEGSILYNKTGEINLPIVDIIPRYSRAYSGGAIQSGNRYIFNTPIDYSNKLYDSSTDNFKKAFVSLLYNEMYGNSKMGMTGVTQNYWNNDPHPISLEFLPQRVYSYYSGEDYISTSDGGRGIGAYVKRILIYKGVYHDGSQYILNNPYMLRTSSGIDVPDCSPYVNELWDYTEEQEPICPNGTRKKLYTTWNGVGKSFEIDPVRLYEHLAQNGELPFSIPKNTIHDISLECILFALRKNIPSGKLADGNLSIKPKIYWN